MKRTLSFILSLIILIGVFSVLPASAKKKSKTYKSGKFTYTVNNGTAKLTSYSGKQATVKLPNKLGKYKLTEIDDYAIENNKTKTVVIPKTVKKISPLSFGSYGKIKKISVAKDNKYYSSDKSGVLYNKKKTVLLYFPINKKVKTYTVAKTVKEIGERAFDGAYYLKNVNLPEGLKKIGLRSFGDCKIKSIKFPSTLQEIGELAFIGCKFKTLTFPASLKIIGKSAFVFDDDDDNDAKPVLTSVTLNEGLEQIAAGAFSGNALTSVTIPSTVKKLSNSAFDCPKLKSYNVSDANPYYSSDNGVLYNKNKTTLIAYPNAKAIPNNFIIPDGVKKLGASVFEGRKIKSIKLPETLEEIGKSSFEDCDLSSIVIPKSVKVIGKSAFFYMDDENSLKSVTFSEGLEKIGEEAFAYTQLKSINLPSTLKEIGDEAFLETNLSSLVIPKGVKTIGAKCFWACENLKKLTLNEGLERIGESAFWNTSIKAIKLPSTLKYLGDRAFNETLITTVHLPASLKYFGEGAFSSDTDSSRIKEITVAKGNKYYSSKDGVLYNKKRTKLLYYPSRRKVKSFKTPKSVKTIVSGAFECAHITNITVTGNVKTVEKRAFENSNCKTAVFKKGVKEIGAYAFYSGEVEKVKLPEGLKRIANSTFYASDLKSINIPKSVKTIGKEAFFGTNLGKITVPPTVKKIGMDAIGILYGECGSYGGVNKHTIIRCKYNSAAYKYAKKQKVKYELY